MTEQQAKLEHCAALCAERAWRLALALLRRREDAEDVAQQAFVVAASKPDAVPAADPWPWFATVVTNLARNAIRKRRRFSHNVSEEAIAVTDASRNASEMLEAAELAERVRAELDRLPEPEREALVLTHIGGMNHAVAANALKMPVGTLSSHVSRGLERLRRRLGVQNETLAKNLAALPLAGPVGGITAASQAWVAGAASGSAAGGASTLSGSTGTTMSLLGGGAMTKYVIAVGVVVALALGAWYVAAQDDADRNNITVTKTGNRPTNTDLRTVKKRTNPENGSRPVKTTAVPATAVDSETPPETDQPSRGAKSTDESNPHASTAAPNAETPEIIPDSPVEMPASPSTKPTPNNDAKPTVRGSVTPARRFGEERFNHGGGEIAGIAFSPDGTTIASSGSGGIKLWNAATGELLRTFPMKDASLPGDIKFISYGSKVVTAQLKNRSWGTTILEVETGKVTAELVGVTGTDLSPDGNAIIGRKKKGADNDEWVVWDYVSGHVRGFQTSQPAAMYPDERLNWSFSVSASNAMALFHFLRVWVPITDPEEKARTRNKMKEAEEAFIHVWDKSTGALLRSIVVPNTVSNMAISADGRMLATTHSSLGAPQTNAPASGEGQPERIPHIVLRNAIDGSAMLSLRGDDRDEKHSKLLFSSDGTRLFSLAEYGSTDAIRVWNTISGEQAAQFEVEPSEKIVSFALSPDGWRIAGGTKGGRIIVWDLVTGQLVSPTAPQEGLPVGTGSVSAAAFTSDGKQVLLAGDGGVTLWTVSDGKVVQKLKDAGGNGGAGGMYASLTVSPDGRFALWSKVMTGYLTLCDMTGMAEPRELVIGTGSATLPDDGMAAMTPPTVETIAWQPGGKLIATNSAKNGILLWNPETGEISASLKGHSNSVYHLSWTPDGSKLLSASWDKTIRIWDPQSHECMATLDTGGEVHALAVSPDGTLAASRDYNGKEIILWDIAKREKLRSFPMPEHTVCDRLTFTPGNCIVSSDGIRPRSNILSRGQITMLDSATGAELANFNGHEGKVSVMTVSPDGRTLLTCGWDGKVLLWNLWQ